MANYSLDVMRANGIDLTKIIETFPDFPKKGILFRDVNPVFRRYDALSFISQEFCNQLRGYSIDFIIGIESRGFVVATALALAMGSPSDRFPVAVTAGSVIGLARSLAMRRRTRLGTDRGLVLRACSHRKWLCGWDPGDGLRDGPATPSHRSSGANAAGG